MVGVPVVRMLVENRNMKELITPVIESRHLSFCYDAKRSILTDVSVAIQPGDFVGIIGPNGSGKSTFLRLLLGLIPIQSGSLRLFGHPIETFRDWKNIGYVSQTGFQGEKNFPATVAEVIAAGSFNRSFFPGKKERQLLSERVRSVAETVGITHLLDRRIGELSGGEEQRTFIAQALLSDPLLLVLDEPTAGVDIATEESFYRLLRELNGRGKTVVLVSHDLEALAHNVKTALCLNQSVVYFGPADGLHRPEIVEATFGWQAWHRNHSEKQIV